jgi:uncharacterized linocin/CFP29 family protein
MNGLFRELAPISEAAWSEIDKEAKRTLKTMLGARRLVDFSGPLGWHVAAINTGRLEPLASLPSGGQLEARRRHVQSLVELRAPFDLRRTELEAIDRGAPDPDLDTLIDAAETIARAENRAVFHDLPSADIVGICTASGAPLSLSRDYTDYPMVVSRAIGRLRDSGVGGPYAIALSERCYTGLTETTKSGYPVMEHVRRLIDGPIVWTPALEGAAVLSMRGGDFELTVGQDLSIGYLQHDANHVRLYIQESFTFRVLSAHAAVPLSYGETAEV